MKIATLATTLLFVLGMFAVLASPASAGTTFVEDAFETNESGDGKLAGDTTDNGLTWGAPASGTSILVGPHYGQGGTDGAGGGDIATYGVQQTQVDFNAVSTGKVFLSYEYHVGGGSFGGYQQMLGGGAGVSAITVGHGQAGATGVHHEGGAVVNENNTNVFAAQPSNISVLAVYDLDALALTVTVEDLDNAANVLIPSHDVVLNAGFQPGYFKLYMNGSCNCFTTNSHGIDNLRIADTAIPEPSSLFLLSLGCVALLATRRRRQA